MCENAMTYDLLIIELKCNILERGSPIAYSNLNTFEDHEKYPDRVDSDNIWNVIYL